jgi:catechol 2,3-dioxygenase
MSSIIHSETNIGLVKLRITDLKRSLAFYQEVVGLKVLKVEDHTAELTADGVKPLVLLEEVASAEVAPRRKYAGLYHFAILVPDRQSLGLALRNLISSKIHIGQADHLVSEALYIADPDNNGIEIYYDRPRSTWKRDDNNHYMMAVDPIDWDGLLALAGDEAWNGLPQGTTIGHIHLHVSSLSEARKFYTEVLGFEVVAHMENSALFVSAGQYHHHIGLNIWAGVGAPLAPVSGAGLAYYTIVVPDHEALEAVHNRLTNAGVAVEKSGGWLVFKDPTGIELHLGVAGA